jgi:hypothetical protein
MVWLLLFRVVPPSPGGAGHLVYQFAEAATKLKIKNILRCCQNPHAQARETGLAVNSTH